MMSFGICVRKYLDYTSKNHSNNFKRTIRVLNLRQFLKCLISDNFSSMHQKLIRINNGTCLEYLSNMNWNKC